MRPTGTENLSIEEMRKWFADRGMLAEQQKKPKPKPPKSLKQSWFIRWLDRITPPTKLD